MEINNRIAALRQKMEENSLSAYLIPSSDPHQSEYLPEHYKTRAYISGFTGSAGTVVVTKNKAVLWTDGRYFLQAENQLAGTEVELYRMGEPETPSVNGFLKTVLKQNERLGMDGKVVALQTYEAMQKDLEGIALVTGLDLVGEIWKDRPEPVLSTAFVHEERYTGKSAQEKIAEVRKMLREHNADSTVIGALEDVCYLFNIRGRDIRCNPVVTAYAVIDQNRALLFIADRQLTPEVKTYLASQGVQTADYEAVFEEAAKLEGTVYLDPARTNT